MLVTQTHAGRLGGAVHVPRTWDEAAAVLREHPLDGAVSGGATYLMWRAAHGEPMPEHLVSLHRIDGRDGAAEVTEQSVGALATLRRLERGPVTGAQRALTMAASVTAGPAVRTLATLGGNLASGFGRADLVPALLALDATVHLHDGGVVPVTEVVEQGVPTSRLMTRVTHELSAADGWTGASVKLARRGMDLSVAVASAVLRVDGGEVAEARVAVGSLYDRPVRLAEIEAALPGADTSDDTMAELVEVVGVGRRRFCDDDDVSSGYRARIAGPVVRKALTLALRLGVDGRPRPGEARV